jgi:prolyl-tRNA synthetase
MGSYGIGLERGMAAIVETHHDDRGIIWPVSVAPFEVVITVLRGDDPATTATAEKVYSELLGSGVDVILDDRSERPGVKFADSELVGIPYRVTIGPRGVESGVVELTTRSDLSTGEVSLDSIVGDLVEQVDLGRSLI